MVYIYNTPTDRNVVYEGILLQFCDDAGIYLSRFGRRFGGGGGSYLIVEN